MLTGDLARELGISLGALSKLARSIEVEKRYGRQWWTPETIEIVKQKLERQAETRKLKDLYPLSPEVASRFGIGVPDLYALIHKHGLQVEKDPAGKYQWTEEAVAAAKALAEELARRAKSSRPPGLTSKQMAARLKMKYRSFVPFSLACRKRDRSLQPVRHGSALYWREEDVAVLVQALADERTKPDVRQGRQAREQKSRLARLREHAQGIGSCIEDMGIPQAGEVERHLGEIQVLCNEIEAALTVSLTFISTLAGEGWSLRHPVAVWVRPVAGGYEAEPVDFALAILGTTRQGAVAALRHAISRRYQELAQDPEQDAPAWAALRQVVVPPLE